MALPNVGSVARPGPTSPSPAPGKRFQDVLRSPARGAPSEVEPRPVLPLAQGELAARPTAAGAVTSSGAARGAVQAGRLVDDVRAAQRRMDALLQLAASGRTFTPVELIAMQARVAQASQELDLAGKLVDRVTGGVKQVLQTQV